MRVAQSRYRARCCAGRWRIACRSWSAPRCWWCSSGLLATRLGTEFIPSLDEGDIAVHALRIPGTSLTQAVTMQDDAGAPHRGVARGRARLQQDRHGGDRQRSDAAVGGRHLRDAQAARGLARPAQAQGEAASQEIEAVARALPGNNYEFTQPIQMRMNELISGVRADVAVKVYGDDLDMLIDGGAERIEAVRADRAGRGRRRVEADHRPAAADRSRPTAQALVALRPQPGRRAGHGGHGRRRRRSPASCSRATGASTSSCACPKRCGRIRRGSPTCRFRCRRATQRRRSPAAARTGPAASRASCRCAKWRRSKTAQGPTRSTARTASAASWSPPTCAAATSAASSPNCASASTREVEVPPGYWIDYGGTFEQLISASQRLASSCR